MLIRPTAQVTKWNNLSRSFYKNKDKTIWTMVIHLKKCIWLQLNNNKTTSWDASSNLNMNNNNNSNNNRNLYRPIKMGKLLVWPKILIVGSSMLLEVMGNLMLILLISKNLKWSSIKTTWMVRKSEAKRTKAIYLTPNSK